VGQFYIAGDTYHFFSGTSFIPQLKIGSEKEKSHPKNLKKPLFTPLLFQYSFVALVG
jgi:hypothetical protein